MRLPRVCALLSDEPCGRRRAGPGWDGAPGPRGTCRTMLAALGISVPLALTAGHSPAPSQPPAGLRRTAFGVMLGARAWAWTAASQ